MKELLPMNDLGLLATKDEEIFVDSRKVAEFFEKEHYTVLRDIDVLRQKLANSSQDVGAYKFVCSSYKTLQNKRGKRVLLNKNAFILLVMSYNTQKATDVKIWYINKFEEMEKQLKSYLSLKAEYPAFTKALSQIKTDNPYLYSTENDLVYKVATGLSARQWRKALGLEKGQSIRPHLTSEQCESVNDVQRYDSVLLDLYDDYQVRKSLLIKKFTKEDK